MPRFTRLPRRFGPYRVLRELGAGGMGTVYEAVEERAGRRVALKVPQDTAPESVERFFREARFAQGVRHPHVCRIFDIGHVSGTPFLTMPLIDGDRLDRLIGREGPWEPKRAASLVRKLASALGAFHDQRAIHRDLKPHNVMVRAEDEPVVMDFGLARDLSGELVTLTETGAANGTPCYMAPEQIDSEGRDLTYATDVYGLGVILYELLTGRRPFDGSSTQQLFNRILNTPPVPPSRIESAVDPTIEAICLKMLAKRQEDRYQSMAAVAEALSAYLCPSEVVVSAPGVWLSRPAGASLASEWSEVTRTPAKVRLRVGTVHALELDGDVIDQDLADVADLCRRVDLQRVVIQGKTFGSGHVTNAGLARLSGLTGLRELDVSCCRQITDAGLAHLSGLTGLRELGLRNCGITGTGLAHLVELTMLRKLNLYYSRVTEAGLPYLAGLRNVRELDFSFMGEVTDPSVACLAAMTGLQTLNLHCLDLWMEADIARLAVLTNLNSLDLDLCRYATDSWLAHLAGMKNITELSFHLCLEITEAGLAYLAGLSGLRKLSFSECHSITDAGLVHLAGLSNLRELSFWACPGITDNGLTALRHKLPGCRIVHE